MPYYITDKNPDCSGWAVEDQAGETFGCHTTKQGAIDQAIAISLSDNEEFVGERAAVGSLFIGDYVSWDVLNPEILAEIVMVEGQLALLSLYEFEDGIFYPTDKLLVLNIFKLERIPRPEFVAEKEELPKPEDVGDGMAYTPDEQLTAMRNVDGPNVIISDIDDTLISGGRRVDRVWAFLQEQEGELFLVTGRPDSTRAETERELADLEITYSELRMNPGSTADSVAFKKSEAESILKTYNVVVAVENNADALAAYRDLGIEAVDPADIPAANRWSTVASNLVAKLEQVDSMTNRDKWLSVAWAIKSRLDGGEARAVGGVETRTGHVALEVREGSDGMTFEGYAAVFNSPSEPLPFTEVIAPGAFKRSLQGRHRMMLLWNHDASQPLASTRNGSLRLTEDATGLLVSATLPNTTLGRDIAEQVRSGLTDAMSFGFQVKKDSWSADGSTRTLHEVALHEVSLVSFPAYEGTAGSVSVRSINADVLADGLLRLESGEELSADQAATIKEVVDKLSATEDVQEVNGDILALKKKKLDLLLKGI